MKNLILLLVLLAFGISATFAQSPRPYPHNAAFLGYVQITDSLRVGDSLYIHTLRNKDVEVSTQLCVYVDTLTGRLFAYDCFSLDTTSYVATTGNQSIWGNKSFKDTIYLGNALVKGQVNDIYFRNDCTGDFDIEFWNLLAGQSTQLVAKSATSSGYWGAFSNTHPITYFRDKFVVGANSDASGIYLAAFAPGQNIEIYAEGGTNLYGDLRLHNIDSSHTTKQLFYNTTSKDISYGTVFPSWNLGGNTIGSNNNFFGSTDNRSVRIGANNTTAITVDSATRNVGIGIAPTAKLDVNGGLKVTSGHGSAATNRISFTGSNHFIENSSSSDFRINFNGFMYFQEGSTSRFYFQSNLFSPLANVVFNLGTSSNYFNDLFIDDITGWGNTQFNISHARHTTANTAGNNLSIVAGGATSGSTDKAGGNLIISSGTSTGTGSGDIEFYTATPSASGTTDNVPNLKWTLRGDGVMRTWDAGYFKFLSANTYNVADFKQTDAPGSVIIQYAFSKYGMYTSSIPMQLFALNSDLYLNQYASPGQCAKTYIGDGAVGIRTSSITAGYDLDVVGEVLIRDNLTAKTTTSTHGYNSSIIDNLTNATADTLFSIPLAADIVFNATMSYGISATDGDTTQAESGIMLISAVNTGAALQSSFTTLGSTQPTGMLGTLSKTLSLSLASNVLYVIVNVTSSITPTTMNIRVTPDLHTAQSITKF